MLERHQVWAYLAAIALGLALGLAQPAAAPWLEAALWPALALLLYATFVQVPLDHLTDAVRDRRFVLAVLTGNFVAVPLLVAVLLPLVPDAPALRLGVLLVLLVPCTDWYVTFTHVARGDTARAIAVTPLNLVAQLLLLPAYLWAFLGEDVAAGFDPPRLLAVLGLLIAAPLAAAWATERWARRAPAGGALVARLAWAPVPLLALVVLLIAGAQATSLPALVPVLGDALLVFVLYLVASVALGVAIARATALPVRAGRALVLSLATRNSFVVLPVALALPAGFAVTAVVIVLQSLVELLGMIALVRLLPTRLMPDRGG